MPTSQRPRIQLDDTGCPRVRPDGPMIPRRANYFDRLRPVTDGELRAGAARMHARIWPSGRPGRRKAAPQVERVQVPTGARDDA